MFKPLFKLVNPSLLQAKPTWLDPCQSAARLDLHTFALLLTADEGKCKLFTLHPITAAFVVFLSFFAHVVI